MQSTTSAWKFVLSAIALALIFATAVGAEAERTRILGTDDWPIDSILDPGSLSCAGGEVVWLNPVTPTCPTSGRLKIRDVMAYGCLAASTTDGVPVPSFTGVAVYVLNGNLDAAYGGPVWGTWLAVPSENCDLQALEAPTAFWHGTWSGRRSRVCEGSECSWIGVLKMVGRGQGEGLAGLRFKGTETIQTFTPMPLPYELIGLCPPAGPCPPEGIVLGVISE